MRLSGWGALLVFIAILVPALTTADRTRLGLATGVVAAYVLVFARLGSPAERIHLVEYGVVALLIHAALAERAAQGQVVWRPALLAVIATSLLVSIDEGIQWLLPSRVFDPIDNGFNVLAATMAVVAVTVHAVNDRRERRRRSLIPSSIREVWKALGPDDSGTDAARPSGCEQHRTIEEISWLRNTSAHGCRHDGSSDLPGRRTAGCIASRAAASVCGARSRESGEPPV